MDVGISEIRITVVIVGILGSLGLSYYYWRDVKKSHD